MKLYDNMRPYVRVKSEVSQGEQTVNDTMGLTHTVAPESSKGGPDRVSPAQHAKVQQENIYLCSIVLYPIARPGAVQLTPVETGKSRFILRKSEKI